MEWKKVKINAQNVLRETDKAVLIKLPKSDFQFWHPKKCIRTMSKGKGYWLSMSFTDDFKFNAKRFGTKFNVLEEKVFSASEIENIFEPIEDLKARFLSEQGDVSELED